MNDFEVRRESRIKPKLGLAILAVLGLTVMAFARSEERVLGGEIMPLEYIPMQRDAALIETDRLLAKWTDLHIVHDVKLKLTDASGRKIEFVADGYDASKKFAYEITGYYSGTNAPDELSAAEISKITNSNFGNYRLLIIDEGSQYSISNAIANYFSTHTNR